MGIFKILFLNAIILLNYSVLNAQTIIDYQFKKGEILDILLITNKPDSGPLFDNYKKTAFPVASKMSYQPLPGFQIAAFTQGNQQPQNFIIAKWENLEKREKFITDVVRQVPDFQEQRRAIWSRFELTYYEMPRDINFKIDKDKFLVATAYWQNDKAKFQKFKKQWQKTAKKLGGETIIELTDGKSPFEYYYQPDYLVLTQWENKAAFDRFYKKNRKMDHSGVNHVNQFILK